MNQQIFCQMNRILKFLSVICIMTAHVIPSFSQAGGEIRRPAVAGRFYPADPDTLRSEVNRFLSEAGTDSISSVRAIIVPHAGYVFSGATASKAYACIAPSAHYRRVFLLGPSHRAAFDGASVNGASPAYATPLGEVKVDQETCERLAHSDDVFCYLPQAHQKEHCLEVQLPFLQQRLQSVPPIVPVIVGTQRIEKLERVAQALLPYFTSENLFVISSDFSHYPPYADACKADKATGDAILSASVENFMRAIAGNSSHGYQNLLTSACGQAPIAVLLLMMQQTPGLQMKHLGYCNSGDSPYGGRDEVVGYHAFAVSEGGGGKTFRHVSDTFSLRAAEKAELLRIARKSIENELEGKMELPYDSARLTDTLKMNCGAFVTLHLNGKLRGCIGMLAGRRPLYLTVSDMARAAAFEDARFRPVTLEEMKDVRIDISVLSPLRKIHSVEEFELGKHGIFMVKDARSGTFLPQVAEETHWTKEEFLGHCARDKAGIGWNGWRSAELYVYEAEVFDEGGGE